jgi:protein-S-isoprenylcysteine O-methyltransferase Ste14
LTAGRARAKAEAHEGKRMTDPTDRASRIPWPPILYVAGLGLPWLLSALLPLPAMVPDGIVGDIAVATGWALMAWGVALGWFAIRSFMGAGTAIHPTHPADRLVTFGLYNSTRNPMYLGAMIAFAGLALATGNAWRFIALPPLVIGLTRLAILPEEAYLARRFGQEYADWKARVPRWF